MIALDTNIYIYFLENNPDFFADAEQAIKYALNEGSIPVPTIVLMEILSGVSNEEVLKFFASKQFTICDFTYDMAVLAGKLRYDHASLKAADAIHVATAVTSGASQFITNDEHLTRLNVGIEIVPLSRGL